MHGFNGYALGAGNSQPVAQPSPVSSLDPNLYGQLPSPATWPPDDPLPGGNHQVPSAYAPRPPGTYAGGPEQHGTAAPQARRKNAALSVTSMICGIAGVVLGVGAQVPLMLVIVEFNQWPRWIIGTLSVAGTVADGGTVLLGVVGVITGVLALIQIRRSGGRKRGGWMAITGISTGGVVLSLAAFIVLLAWMMGGS